MAKVSVVKLNPSASIELTPEELKGLASLLTNAITSGALCKLHLNDLQSKINQFASSEFHFVHPDATCDKNCTHGMTLHIK